MYEYKRVDSFLRITADTETKNRYSISMAVRPNNRYYRKKRKMYYFSKKVV